MSKLAEILKSGKAPGVRCGQEPFDETSVYGKVPRALKEVENEPLFKHGPARGASRIAKSFGMSADTIRREWSKPVPLILFILCLLTFSSKAGDITAGQTFQDGQTVNAAQLMNLVNLATINSQFISAKPIDPAPLTSDTFVLYSPTLGGLYRITLGSAVLSNTNLITTQTEKTVPVSGDYLLMLDSVTGSFAKVSIGNLVLNNTNVIFGGPFIVQTNLDPQLIVPIRELWHERNYDGFQHLLFSVRVVVDQLPGYHCDDEHGFPVDLEYSDKLSKSGWNKSIRGNDSSSERGAIHDCGEQHLCD